MLKLAFAAFAGLSLSLLVAGCAAEPTSDEEGDEVSSEDALRAAGITPGTFKLHSKPNAEPNANCDVHTELTLSNKSGARAALREVVGGLCEIFVEPNPRGYRLRLDGTSCGSKIFKGKKRIAGKTREITITDHRTRICDDVVPARIVVDESDGAGHVTTTYSYDAPPAVAVIGQWLSFGPKQCGSNPWNGTKPGADASQLPGEAGDVDNFFRSQGIGLELVGFAYPSEPMMVCQACSCPRGDSLLVKAKTTADAQRLTAEFGFAAIQGAYTTSPTQCGTNPWEEASNPRDESHNLSTWAAGAEAPLTSAGFLSYTEPMMVCEACSCPRGDVAAAFPKTKAAGAKLKSFGWAPLEN